MDMSSDPGMLLLVGKGFDIGVRVVCRYTYKEESRNALSGVRLYDLSRISGPVDSDPLVGFTIDVHRYSAFFHPSGCRSRAENT
mgnify:CR=1 FL=1